MADKIRVLIVNDSSFMCEAIKSILEEDPKIEVIGLAKDGKEGVEKAFQLRPDVIAMDLEMPIMSGFEAIEHIMEKNPIPIIVVSTKDIPIIIKSLGIGAMDFVAVKQEIEEIAQDLVEKVKIASRVRPLRRIRIRPIVMKRHIEEKKATPCRVVAIGISTGGPQALQVLLSKLPANLSCGFLIVQHISRGFIEGLAEWLQTISPLSIRVAKTGDIIGAGEVLLAPDDYHIKIGAGRRVLLLSEDTARSNPHVPSIDVMMQSVAEAFGKEAVGVIMTGMGHDGVEGIKAIKKAGGKTIAQDEKTSVVFGMNREAIETGCVDRVVALEKIADEIVSMVIN
ncbi:MAG: chemotaxis-specific protein-glutamate methyltransferase CheB [Thermodesulfobacteriota bacterium]